MTLDSSNSSSTAKETVCLQASEGNESLKGNHISEPEHSAGSAIKMYTEESTSWSYLFVHNQKVRSIENLLKKDGRRYFIHKTIKYVPRRGKKHGACEIETPSVSGLIFLQGSANEIQAYLDERLPYHRLCKNCSTHEVAVIPNRQMDPFMRVAETAPDRIRFLLRPFVYYSQNHTLLRIVSGDYAGLEGYVVRMARDRKLVMDVGGMSVAIGGIHAERFEEVGKNEANRYECATFRKRNLHERNAFIDRYFHQVKSVSEVAAQAEDIDILRSNTIADHCADRMTTAELYETLYFMIEEIAYYYAPLVHRFKDALHPIFDAGKKVLQDLYAVITATPHDTDLRQRYESEYEELTATHGYLFE